MTDLRDPDLRALLCDQRLPTVERAWRNPEFPRRSSASASTPPTASPTRPQPSTPASNSPPPPPAKGPTPTRPPAPDELPKRGNDGTGLTLRCRQAGRLGPLLVTASARREGSSVLAAASRGREHSRLRPGGGTPAKSRPHRAARRGLGWSRSPASTRARRKLTGFRIVGSVTVPTERDRARRKISLCHGGPRYVALPLDDLSGSSL